MSVTLETVTKRKPEPTAEQVAAVVPLLDLADEYAAEDRCVSMQSQDAGPGPCRAR
jgi:hypothetical protein